MIIRKATKTDSPSIARYLLLAMEEIVFEFIGENNPEKALTFMHFLVTAENNQYSYQNCWVVEEDGSVVAAVTVYDGGQLEELRAPVAQYVREEYKQPFNPEHETQSGEFYIDSFGVDPGQQGKGIGSAMLQFLIDEYVHKNGQILGLLVDKENPGAKKLYLKLGFRVVGEKTLVGKQMEHLQVMGNRG
ncbi:GNAT family N-acetyltransferase [Fluviicola sp. SGL-29]|nr:GNAT family N-acetyltransferase [Fluviicola sp. SGL-29]